MCRLALRRRELEAHLDLGLTRHDDLFSGGGVAGCDDADHVDAGSGADRRGKRDLADLEPVELHARARDRDLNHDFTDPLGLLLALFAHAGQALRVETLGRGQQLVEYLDRGHRSAHGREHQPDIVEQQRMRRQLVGALELGQCALVVPLIEQAQAAVEAHPRLLALSLAGLGPSDRRSERGVNHEEREAEGDGRQCGTPDH